MKILHICLSGGWYAQNAYQDQLLPRYHRRLGHEVTVVASYCGRWNLDKHNYDIDTTKEALLPDGIKVLRISPALPLKVNAHIHLFKGLKKVLSDEKPDLIFLHNMVCLNYISAASYKKRHPEVKIVCDNHADWQNSHHHWASKLWSEVVIKRLLARKLIAASEWFYGVTPVRCDYLSAVYNVPKPKIKLLLLGADDDEMRAESRSEIRDEIRGKYSVADDDFLIVTGGRIDKKKSVYFHALAQAVCNINNEKLKLLVFGPVSDDAKPLFRDVENDRVLWAGAIPSNRVYDYFYAADLVVFPGLHSVMWEQAVASRVPCIFHRIEGFGHVDFGGNCLFAEKDDATEYQVLIENLLADSNLYSTLLEQARSEGADKFLYSHIAQQVLDDVYTP